MHTFVFFLFDVCKFSKWSWFIKRDDEACKKKKTQKKSKKVQIVVTLLIARSNSWISSSCIYLHRRYNLVFWIKKCLNIDSLILENKKNILLSA